MRTIALCILCLLLLPALPARALWPVTGRALPSIAANSYTGDLAPDGLGGAYVLMVDVSASPRRLLLVHVLADGELDPNWPVGGRVLDYTTDNAYSGTALVANGSHGVWAMWSDEDTGVRSIMAQYVWSSGVPWFGPEGTPVGTPSKGATQPKAVGDGNGGFYVAWISTDTQTLRGQHIDGAGDSVGGSMDGFVLASPTTPIQDHAVALGDYFYVTWSDARTGTLDVYLQRADVFAQRPLLTPNNGYVVCSVFGHETLPAITTDGLNGDCVIAWRDTRATGAVAYAQRLTGDGTTLWSANGVILSSMGSVPGGPRVVSDGAGGVYIGGANIGGTLLSRSFNCWLQRRDGAGAAAAGWSPSGLVLAQLEPPINPGLHQFGQLVSNTAGGVYMSWLVASDEIRAGGVSADGSMSRGWSSSGYLVREQSNALSPPAMIQDGEGQALLAWFDQSDTAVHVQRLHELSLTGSYVSTIYAVEDVEDDEGGAVTLHLQAANADVAAITPYVTGYNVWRVVPGGAGKLAPSTGDPTELLARAQHEPITLGIDAAQALGMPLEIWESLGFHATLGAPTLALGVPTRNTASPLDPAIDTWIVTTHTTNPLSFAVSLPVSGASIDNRPPAAPVAFVSNWQAGGLQLGWAQNQENDLAGYVVYRGSSPDFVPGPATEIARPTGLGYLDSFADGSSYYKLSAVDRHGNESATIFLQASVTSPALSSPTYLGVPSPNPFGSVTSIAFGLARRGAVELTVFDVSGRRVRTILAAERSAERHLVVWDGNDDRGERVGRGNYFVRLRSVDAELVQKVVLVR